MKGNAKVGGHVIFVDAHGVERDAVLLAVWGQGLPDDQYPSVNVVLVNPDESMDDMYGRQIMRETSVVHQSSQPAHGNYWRML